MRMRRRSFITTSLAAGAAMAVPHLRAKMALSSSQGGAPTLPWYREMALREAAKAVNLESILNATNPLPSYGGEPVSGFAMAINNLKMRTTIWGPPERITISLNKNNIWDRRLHDFRPPTLKEITEGAFAEVNENYVGVEGNSIRPKDLGWLWKGGGSHDPYRQPMRYAFPSFKPAGQIILGVDSFAGATPPRVLHNCANGLVRLHPVKGAASAQLEYVLGMTSNVYAFRGVFTGVAAPFWLRLYRHRDASHLAYMSADGKTYINPAAEADKAFNGPIDAPTSGNDGRYFWIRQRMPAEKTFPEGFEYVLMGVVTSPGQAKLESVEGKTGLGTPPPLTEVQWDLHGVPVPSIADAPGAATTAILEPGSDGNVEGLFTIVTTMDGSDIPALAKERLSQAEAGGFDALVEENAKWWVAFYDRRENGRVFHGTSGTECSDDIRSIYRSYADSHGGGTKTDMRQLECSASYAQPERDIQQWDSAPCYNEIFTTSRFVHNWATAKICGSRSCGIGCRELKRMRNICLGCPAC